MNNFAAIPLQLLTARLVDETHAECVERVRRQNHHALYPIHDDHDAHVMAWRVAMWDMIEDIAWLRRQEKLLMEGH